MRLHFVQKDPEKSRSAGRSDRFQAVPRKVRQDNQRTEHLLEVRFTYSRKNERLHGQGIHGLFGLAQLPLDQQQIEGA